MYFVIIESFGGSFPDIVSSTRFIIKKSKLYRFNSEYPQKAFLWLQKFHYTIVSIYNKQIKSRSKFVMLLIKLLLLLLQLLLLRVFLLTLVIFEYEIVRF